MVWGSLYDLITGRYGLEQMSGPVGITEQIGTAAQTSSVDLSYLCAVIAINLGVVNLLPLPALDGGRALLLLLAMLRGKDLDPELRAHTFCRSCTVDAADGICHRDIRRLF